MAVLIREAIAMIASILVVIIAFSIFQPLIDQVLASYVTEALLNPGVTALAVNGNSLLLTKDLILMGMKTGWWFVVFAIFARFFLYVSLKDQEQGVY